MASSETTDDSFRDRVAKIFGSLAPSSKQLTLWSITDKEVERKEWGRDTKGGGFSNRDDIPCSSSFEDLRKDRKRSLFRGEYLKDDLDDDEEEMNRRQRGIVETVDEWEVRSWIGLDRTLDNEEEEDEYDKVASGRDNGCNCLYFNDVYDQGPCLNYHKEHVKSFRDPRANRLSAKIRLQEDEAEAQKLGSHHDCNTEFEELRVKASDQDHVQLKSILKRKDSSSDIRSKKRVRFDTCGEVVCKEEAYKNRENISMETCATSAMFSDDGSMPMPLPLQSASGIPDYLRNPSKYTHYNFDSSSDLVEKSNAEAGTNSLRLVRSSKLAESISGLEQAAVDVPKAVTFIPKKKDGEVEVVSNLGEEDNNNQSSQHTGFVVGIAARESQQDEASMVDEDEPQTNSADRSAGLQRPGRSYRTKSISDDFES